MGAYDYVGSVAGNGMFSEAKRREFFKQPPETVLGIEKGAEQ